MALGKAMQENAYKASVETRVPKPMDHEMGVGGLIDPAVV